MTSVIKEIPVKKKEMFSEVDCLKLANFKKCVVNKRHIKSYTTNEKKLLI